MLWIYLLGVFIITFSILIMYFNSKREYDLEIKRIIAIEEKIKQKKDDLAKKRLTTNECPYKNLNDPRSCYTKSEYKCVWNEEIERCDKKK